MTPALRTRSPSASRSSTAAIRPGWKPSSWAHGLRSPVTSTTAVVAQAQPRAGRQRRAGRPRASSRSRPSSPGATAKPARRAARRAARAWIRCTWRRLGWVGSRRHARPVLHRPPRLRVALDAQAGHQPHRLHRSLAQLMLRNTADGHDLAHDAKLPRKTPRTTRQASADRRSRRGRPRPAPRAPRHRGRPRPRPPDRSQPRAAARRRPTAPSTAAVVSASSSDSTTSATADTLVVLAHVHHRTPCDVRP